MNPRSNDTNNPPVRSHILYQGKPTPNGSSMILTSYEVIMDFQMVKKLKIDVVRDNLDDLIREFFNHQGNGYYLIFRP